MKIYVPYGSKSLPIEIDKRRLISVLTPAERRPVDDVEAEIESSLRKPIRSPEIGEIVGLGKRVGIACDDNTRVTPVHMVLPILLKILRECGVRPQDVTVFVALGTHRRMTNGEMREKYGADLVEAYSFVNHEYDDPSELKLVGKIEENVPVWINRRFLACDVRIGLSNVIPHFTAGWSGGSKILLPGLAGRETVGQMHYLSANTMPNAVGRTDVPARRLIDHFGQKVGLHFSVNTVLTRKGEIAGVFSGDPIEARMRAVQLSKTIYGIELPSRADIVVSSSYPADIDFWQAEKGLFSADLATRRGGGILLITPCPEGVSASHSEFAEMLQYRPSEIVSLMETENVKDLIAASLALCVAKTREPYEVCIVSDGISESEAQKLHFRKFAEVEEAMCYLTERCGSDSKVAILSHGGETYPICAEEG